MIWVERDARKPKTDDEVRRAQLKRFQILTQL